MCLECQQKALELDGRIPHFLDRYLGNFHGMVVPDESYLPAEKELKALMVKKHGKASLL